MPNLRPHLSKHDERGCDLKKTHRRIEEMNLGAPAAPSLGRRRQFRRVAQNGAVCVPRLRVEIWAKEECPMGSARRRGDDENYWAL